MRIAAIQHDIVWEDRDATCRHLVPLVARAAAPGPSSWC
jgi:predicted amidohydrolase